MLEPTKAEALAASLLVHQRLHAARNIVGVVPVPPMLPPQMMAPLVCPNCQSRSEHLSQPWYQRSPELSLHGWTRHESAWCRQGSPLRARRPGKRCKHHMLPKNRVTAVRLSTNVGQYNNAPVIPEVALSTMWRMPATKTDLDVSTQMPDCPPANSAPSAANSNSACSWS